MIALLLVLLTVVPTATALAEDVQEIAILEDNPDPRKSGWEGGHLKEDKADFQVINENGSRFLRSTYLADTEALYLLQKVDWNLQEFPILRWRWRARKFPTGAKIQNSKVSDAAAQLYLVFATGRRKNVIKYFWATDDKVGDEFKQSSIVFGRLFGAILESGPPANEWKWEQRDVVADYKRGFEEDEAPRKVGAIAILSDADETKSESEADYGSFEVRKTLYTAPAPTPAQAPKAAPRKTKKKGA